MEKQTKILGNILAINFNILSEMKTLNKNFKELTHVEKEKIQIIK
tara:strand:+ start:3379 stop:3513 length:135 start_codon:yes stop_codon:yes gene_type:complete